MKQPFRTVCLEFWVDVSGTMTIPYHIISYHITFHRIISDSVFFKLYYRFIMFCTLLFYT